MAEYKFRTEHGIMESIPKTVTAIKKDRWFSGEEIDHVTFDSEWFVVKLKNCERYEIWYNELPKEKSD